MPESFRLLPTAVVVLHFGKDELVVIVCISEARNGVEINGGMARGSSISNKPISYFVNPLRLS